MLSGSPCFTDRETEAQRGKNLPTMKIQLPRLEDRERWGWNPGTMGRHGQTTLLKNESKPRMGCFRLEVQTSNRTRAKQTSSKNPNRASLHAPLWGAHYLCGCMTGPSPRTAPRIRGCFLRWSPILPWPPPLAPPWGSLLGAGLTEAHGHHTVPTQALPSYHS